MSTIVRIGPYSVQIYADDHYPPHFHIVAPDFEMLVAIEGLSVLKGGRHVRKVGEVLTWADQHRELLLLEWNKRNEE